MKRRVILIGGNGIGRACLDGFRGCGDDVLLVEAADVPDVPAPGRVVQLRRDADDPAMPTAAAAACVEAYGGIDCLVVTPSLMRTAAIADWTPAMWDASLATNLKLPFFLARAVAGQLGRSASPSIVLLSSTAALRGSAGAAPYQAGKAALLALVRSLADEFGPSGIRVNCVLPGWIETPLTAAYWRTQPAERRAAIEGRIPLRRQGSAREVAEVILFLASPAARYVNGTSIIVDGGFTAV